jgi:hypothetical protein
VAIAANKAWQMLELPQVIGTGALEAGCHSEKSAGHPDGGASGTRRRVTKEIVTKLVESLANRPLKFVDHYFRRGIVCR